MFSIFLVIFIMLPEAFSKCIPLSEKIRIIRPLGDKFEVSTMYYVLFIIFYLLFLVKVKIKPKTNLQV